MTVLTVHPLTGVPEVTTDTDLAHELLAALVRAGLQLEDGDVLVVSSKVVSKAAGLRLDGADPESRDDLVTKETRRVVAERMAGDRPTRVVEAAAGPVMAAAGVDASNTGDGGALWLPHDPDAAAAELRSALGLGGRPVAVLLSDTAGRPWRAGQTDFALGAAGLLVIDDLRGGTDADGRPLLVTARAVADEIAAAADLVKGKADGVPAALVRGLAGSADPDTEDGAAVLVRTGPTDWFSHGTAEAVRASLGVEPGGPESERVGIASVAPEPLRDRVARAVAVALYACPDVAADVGSADVTLSGLDAFEVGRATARLEVALWGEHLRADHPSPAAGGAVRLGWTDLLAERF